MKKLLLTAVGCVVALASYGQAKELYITGSTTSPSWNPGSPEVLELQDGNTYTYTFPQGAKPEFKISTAKGTTSGDWNTFNSNALYANIKEANTEYQMSKGDSNIVAPGESDFTLKITYKNSNYYISLNTESEVEVVIPEEVFIKGSMNNWGTSPVMALKLQSKEPNAQNQYVYQGTFDKLSAGTVKIGGESNGWGSTINYGKRYNTPVTPGTKLDSWYNTDGFDLSTDLNNVTVTFYWVNDTNAASYIQFDTNETVSYPDALYILGFAGNNGGWASEKGVESNSANSTEGIYTFDNVEITGEGTFSFTTKLSDDWNTLGTRYAALSDGTDVTNGGTFNLQTSNVNASFKATPGNYKMVVDLTVPNLTVTPLSSNNAPDALYFVGNTWAYNNALVSSWDPQNPIAFKKGDNNTFTLTGVELKGDENKAYFNFINTTGTWETLQAGDPFRYGPSAASTQVTVGTPTEFQLLAASNDNSWILEDGVYDFTVDFSNNTFTATKSSVAPFIPAPEIPDNVYLIGNLESTNGEWLPASAPALVNEGDGFFTIENVTLVAAKGDTKAYFAFTNILSEDWEVINDGSHKYGPSTDTAIKLEEEMPFTFTKNNSWNIEPGTYSFYLSFEEGILTVEEGVAPVKEMYVNAAFNDYTPTAADKLTQGDAEDGEDNEYRTYIEIPEGEFSLNFKFGNVYLVPAADGAITFDNGKYTGEYTEGDATSYWTVADWAGAEVEIVVDIEAKTVTFVYTPETADVWYIRGKFNNYNPADNSEWALNPVEDENGVYTGTFTVDSGEFSFNFLSPYGTVFIPESVATEEITFTDGVYNGKMDMAYEESEEAYYWEFPNWTGGEFTVTINLDENSITIETDAEHDTDAVNALYRFTEDDAIYNLQGVKVSNPAKGQIYIINGKKAVLK